jgi:hypothetical protein
LLEPSLLQELSEKVSAQLPVRIAGVSDKLGGLILQLPVQVLNAKFHGLGNQGGAECNIQWLPEVAPRPLTISIACDHDGLFADFVLTSVGHASVKLPLPNSPSLEYATIKDTMSGEAANF